LEQEQDLSQQGRKFAFFTLLEEFFSRFLSFLLMDGDSENINPQHQPGGGESASSSQIGGQAAPIPLIDVPDISSAHPPGYLPPLEPLFGQAMSGPGQPAVLGGGVDGMRPALVPGYLSSAFMNAVEPPRGIDPRRHHTNTPANLSAAVELLSIPGSRTPKVLNEPQPGHPSNNATTSAAGNGPEHARKDSAPENQVHIATQEFPGARRSQVLYLFCRGSC